MDTVFGGTSSTVAGSNLDRSSRRILGSQPDVRVVTVTVIDPTTRLPVAVTYDRQQRAYLDKEIKRWTAAPGWMIAQIR
jgi:hypothetical protein